MTKILDTKLAHIHAGKYTPKDFIIADAKDGDMGFGTTCPGPVRGTDKLKTKAQYLEAMTEMTKSGLVDIMLMSASSAEALHEKKLFIKSKVTPAVRLNDTTDIWSQRGQNYKADFSQPFRTARPEKVKRISDLGLYSVTFSNDVDADLWSLENYRQFREEATKAKMRHFLEVFNPAMDIGVSPSELGHYINDSIVRCLAGVMSAEQPVFLKMQYNGAAAMEELASYDPQRLVVGILGGARGTTRDTFELISQAEKYGARVALFGRKINFAEAPLELVRLMRAVIERNVSPGEAVKMYHGYMIKNKIHCDREIAEDNEITDPTLKS
jgi:DhnA family fructose-bisphosphate aldolase class Ia